MSSDIMLDDNTVTVQAWDLKLDAPDRRKNQTPFRRALVHDFNDGLTLNWGKDYPGGVKICGEVNIDGGNLTLKGADLKLDAPDRRKNQTPLRRALVHDFNDGLTLNWGKDYPGGVKICGEVYIDGGNLTLKGADLKLDAPDRRKNQTPLRRALVHDFNDGLTLNWGKDYPGGVKICGEVYIDDGNLNLKGNAAISGNLKTNEALISDLKTDKIELQGTSQIGGGPIHLTQFNSVKIQPDLMEVSISSGIFRSTLSISSDEITYAKSGDDELKLVAAIKRLLDEVAHLTTRIDKLEHPQ